MVRAETARRETRAEPAASRPSMGAYLIPHTLPPSPMLYLPNVFDEARDVDDDEGGCARLR